MYLVEREIPGQFKHVWPFHFGFFGKRLWHGKQMKKKIALGEKSWLRFGKQQVILVQFLTLKKWKAAKMLKF